MPSPQSIITNALRDLNVLGAGQTAPYAEDTELALSHYNRLVNLLAAQPKFGYFETSQAFTFTTSQQSYTIGPSGSGADFIMTASGSGVRPPKIDRAKLVLTAGTPDTEVELPVITVQIYASIPVPAESSSEPTRLYYQPTFPTGTLWPWPYPTTTSNQLKLYWRSQLATVAIADIATNINMPPAYEDMLTAVLMKRLTIPFRKPLTDDMKELVRAAVMAVTQLNDSDPAFIGTDLYGAKSGYSLARFLARDF